MKRRRQGWPPQSHRYKADRQAQRISAAIAENMRRLPAERCDCQAPDAPTGARLVSMECPIHNENPYPAPESPALTYWRDKLWQAADSVGVRLTDDQLEQMAVDMVTAAEKAPGNDE